MGQLEDWINTLVAKRRQEGVAQDVGIVEGGRGRAQGGDGVESEDGVSERDGVERQGDGPYVCLQGEVGRNQGHVS